ncbi:MAG: Arc family DNA-binding protein [Clostridia bacterium]|nr:Arc family DNA-binding protein [Clostridia bacterium]
MDNEKHFGLRIDDKLLKKFRHVCEYDGRSANSKILVMIRQCVAEYEKEFGEIKLDNK